MKKVQTFYLVWDYIKNIRDTKSHKSYKMIKGQKFKCRLCIESPLTRVDILYNNKWDKGWSRSFFRRENEESSNEY